MTSKANISILGIFILLIVFFSSFYIINEYQQVVITQFGRPVGEPIRDAGFHFKMPFIQAANYFDKRILEWDGKPNQVPTKDKKYIWVDTFARWKIADPLIFYQRVQNITRAQAILDNIINSVTRDNISSYVLTESVRNTNRTFDVGELTLESDQKIVAKPITLGRNTITKKILELVSAKVPEYGIEVVDVKIKRINYIEDVQKKVYERMISERLRIAERSRSEGRGKSAEIEGQMLKDMKKITSEAYQKAQETKGKADAAATKIYAKAYNRDPEFYSFINTLEMYRNSMDENSWLLLTTKSDFYKYLKDYSPQ